MSGEEQTSRIAVLLFTDMVESVALERRLGTEAYSRLLMRHHQLFREAMTAVGGGKIHLDTGDGFLCEFGTAAAAVNTALLFQTALRVEEWEIETPKVRVGLHQGQLAEVRSDPTSQGKIVGIPVSVASRVMNLARPGQILMTRPVYDDARQFIREHPHVAGVTPPALKWKAHGPYLFKGSEEPNEIFEVGASGYAPLSAPINTEKGKRATQQTQLQPAVHPTRRPFISAAVTALCGLVLLTPVGDPWINASYDYIFRFGTRIPNNRLSLILMDNHAYDALGQTRETTPWDRSLHTEMLNKLTDAGAALVAFDILFQEARSKDGDAALAAAMRRNGKVVLMSKTTGGLNPRLAVAQMVRPNPVFLAAATNGICCAGVAELATPREHFAIPDEPGRTLPELAAQLAGAQLEGLPAKRWLRYYGYGEKQPWESFSYPFALSNSPAHFHNRWVFIGNQPQNTNPGLGEKDKFCTPYTRWTGEAVGGIEIMATTFLNLLNHDWLERPPWWLESLCLLALGGLLGWAACFCNRMVLLAVAALLALGVTLGGVSLSYYTNLWFPWLVIVGGQLPCAVAFGLAAVKARTPILVSTTWEAAPDRPAPAVVPGEPLPDAPEYEIFDPPFGEGGFGKVWVARNAVGQWQALKAVYQLKFGQDLGPYEAEFNGLQRYKPVSEKHPGLLRIDLVSRKKGEGYFYYVMELGDSLYPGWEQTPARYKPKDLEAARRLAIGHRLPVTECLRIAIALTEALDFLHRQNLTHRDIKPSNIIFVGGRPKLADVGLVTELRAPESPRTAVGTAGFIPPAPERAGTAQADIYSLGMVLYVISTGNDPESFPDLPTILVDGTGHMDFIRLNAIILKACQPDRAHRYQTATEMLNALRETESFLA